MTEMYSELRKEANELNEKNDCSVRAVAIVSGLPYKEVHALFAKHGRRRRKGTPSHITRTVLRVLGLGTTDVTKEFRGRTVLTVERELKCGPRYLIWIRRHLLAARKGEIHDWTAGRRHRSVRIEKVEPLV